MTSGRLGPVRITAMAGLMAAVVAVGAATTGCSVVKKFEKIRHTVSSNRATIKVFTDSLKTSAAVPFQATYVTTGSSPTTVTYAVQPPKNSSFAETGAGTATTKLISNSTGQYSCSRTSAGARWSCEKLGTASAIAQRQLFSIYTPDHWVTFLHVIAFGAGLAGDKVTTSSKTVNGFAMDCVDLFVKKEGTSTICTTKQNILGYVRVASQSTTFQIKRYTSSPPASAFRLPPGAKITKQ